MKYGSCLYLGLIGAEAIRRDPPDCARHQITCPNCHEAVFKCERLRGDGGVSHYLSHYPEVPDDQVQRCELRARSITPEEIAAARAAAYGQAHALFVARFRDLVLRACSGQASSPEAAGRLSDMLARLEKRSHWRRIARDCLPVARRAWGLDGGRVWKQWREDEAKLRAAYSESAGEWCREAERHAAAMLAHAMSPGSEAAWLALFSATALCIYLSLAARGAELAADPAMAAALEGHADPSGHLYRALGRLVEATNRRLPGTLEELASLPDPRGGSGTLYATAVGGVLNNVPTLLLNVPYEEFFSNAAPLQHPP